MAHKRPHEYFGKKKQLHEQVLEKKISKKKIADKYLIEKLTKKSQTVYHQEKLKINEGDTKHTLREK